MLRRTGNFVVSSFIVSRSGCMTRMVSRSSEVAGVSPNPVGAVTDGAPFQRQLALANPDDETSNATTLVRREPAPGSGFNLLKIAAYSYIVNPCLAYCRRAFPRILAPRLP